MPLRKEIARNFPEIILIMLISFLSLHSLFPFLVRRKRIINAKKVWKVTVFSLTLQLIIQKLRLIVSCGSMLCMAPHEDTTV